MSQIALRATSGLVGSGTSGSLQLKLWKARKICLPKQFQNDDVLTPTMEFFTSGRQAQSITINICFQGLHGRLQAKHQTLSVSFIGWWQRSNADSQRLWHNTDPRLVSGFTGFIPHRLTLTHSFFGRHNAHRFSFDDRNVTARLTSKDWHICTPRCDSPDRLVLASSNSSLSGPMIWHLSGADATSPSVALQGVATPPSCLFPQFRVWGRGVAATPPSKGPVAPHPRPPCRVSRVVWTFETLSRSRGWSSYTCECRATLWH